MQLQSAEVINVWDPVVRIFHWSLVIIFTIAYLSADEASTLHVWSGYVVLGLVGFRILWGFLGTRHARFSTFVYRLPVIVGYGKDLLRGQAKRYLGHNPLGGAMILIMLICLIASGWTGYVLERARQQAATLASHSLSTGVSATSVARGDEDRGDRHRENGRGPRWLKDTHEFFANLMLWLIFIHVGGVALESVMHRENLVRAMWTGRKRA